MRERFTFNRVWVAAIPGPGYELPKQSEAHRMRRLDPTHWVHVHHLNTLVGVLKQAGIALEKCGRVLGGR